MTIKNSLNVVFSTSGHKYSVMYKTEYSTFTWVRTPLDMAVHSTSRDAYMPHIRQLEEWTIERTEQFAYEWVKSYSRKQDFLYQMRDTWFAVDWYFEDPQQATLFGLQWHGVVLRSDIPY